MAPERHIDRLPAVPVRSKEMKLLCVGWSRTSTLSLYTALQKLGYTPYHGREKFFNIPQNHFKCWEEASLAKMNQVDVFGRPEFDKLLGNYDAVSDAPAAFFADELMAAYPNAKVLLTSRDPDAWARSMGSCYYKILYMLNWHPMTYLEPQIWGAFRAGIILNLKYLTGGGSIEDRQKLREGFIKHNEHVRQVAPKDRFLDFDPRDGWEPLCRFLDKDIPSEPYPFVNEGTSAADGVREILWSLLLKKLTIPGVAFLVAMLAWSIRSYW